MVTLQYTNKMTPQAPSNFEIFLQFIQQSWPMIGGIVVGWKFIAECAKYLQKKQDARLRELLKTEVNPQIDSLTKAIDNLREEIGSLRTKL